MSLRPASELILILFFGEFALTPAHADFLGITWGGSAVRIDPITGTSTFVGRTDHVDLNSMARDPNGRFVTANNGGVEIPHLHHVDPLFGKAAVFHVPFLNSIRALAFSTAGVLYAIDSDPSSVQNDLYTLDLSVPFGDSSIKHLIGTTTISGIQGMTFAADGTLYGWGVSNGLVVIDPSTAQTMDVNGLLDGTSEVQTLAFAPDGTLYGAGDRLFIVDRTTGAFAPVGSSTLDSVRGMEFFDPTSTFPYCVAKTNSQDCTPVIGSTGAPSLSGPDDFQVTASEIVNNKLGILLWSLTPARNPFQGGFLCLRAPIVRTTWQSSGGNPPPPDCSGAFSFHFSQQLMTAHGLDAGSSVSTQYYYRDPQHPDGSAIGLSDALRFTIGP